MTTLSPSSSCFKSLPHELLSYLLRFLSGYDLLPLSHVNQRFYAEVLGPSSDLWTTRVPHVKTREGPYGWRELVRQGWLARLRSGRGRRLAPVSDDELQRRQAHRDILKAQRVAHKAELEMSAKRHYFARVSLKFPGHFSHKRAYGRHRGAGVVTPRYAHTHIRWLRASFSFDVWFALLPSAAPPTGTSPANVVGGILIGAHGGSSEMPAVMAQFAHVDPVGSLYCSVVGGEKRMLATLKLERWYHLTLTFDKPVAEGLDGLQSVYLNGALIDTSRGSLPSNWEQLKTFQLGGGFMDAGCVGNLRPEYKGTYGFNGLMDDFRFWTGVLTPDDVQQLHAGREQGVGQAVTCDWSLMRDGKYNSFYGCLSAVRCSRPSEGMCVGVRPAFEVLPINDPYRPH